MASNANWTIVFDDRLVLKNYDEGSVEGLGYIIDDDAFWSQSKFSNIWAIQHGTSVTSDEVEHRDTTPHCSYAEADLGDVSQFTSRWDAAHLAQLQSDWDGDDRDESEKGPRPTSYTSS